MIKQLIVSKKYFLNNMHFSSNMEKTIYIIDYLEIATFFLYDLDLHRYRTISDIGIIEGKTIINIFLENVYNNTSFFCYDVSQNKFIDNTKELSPISEYIGILFDSFR